MTLEWTAKDHHRLNAGSKSSRGSYCIAKRQTDGPEVAFAVDVSDQMAGINKHHVEQRLD